MMDNPSTSPDFCFKSIFQLSIPNIFPPTRCSWYEFSAGRPLSCDALVYVLTTANIVSPASCGQAHSTASFWCRFKLNCRLKLSIVFKGSSTFDSIERPILCFCAASSYETLSMTCGNSSRILVDTCR